MSTRLKPRMTFLITLLGLILGGVGSLVWIIAQGPINPLTHQFRAKPQYERWTKQNQCGGVEERYDATLAMIGTIPEDINREIKNWVIHDTGLEAPTELQVNRADLSASGYQPVCVEGVCEYNIHYPAQRSSPPETGERRDYTLAIKLNDDREITLGAFEDVLVPTTKQSRAAPTAPLSGTWDGDTLVLDMTPNFDSNIDIEVNLIDARGQQEANFSLPYGARGLLTAPIPLIPPITYAGAVLTAYYAYEDVQIQHSVTFADTSDPFFDCGEIPTIATEDAPSGSE